MRRPRPTQSVLPAGLLATALLFAACNDRPLADGDSEAPPPPPPEAGPAPAEVVRLDAEQGASLAIRTVRVQADRFSYGLSLPGTVYPAPENLSLVSAPIGGRVVQIYAHEGEAVRRGQVLLELESLEFANLAADYLQARAEETYQQSQAERLRQLVEKKISPRSALDKAEADLLRAAAAVSAAYARLRAVGVDDDALARWTSGTRERPLLRVYAPITGVISEHAVDLGQAVTAYEQMMSILNLDRVLVRGFVSPEEAPLVRRGAAVEIGTRNRARPPLRATVATINPALDEASKSVTVNVLVATQDGWPIPGDNVRLEIQTESAVPVFMLPLSAVEYEGDRATVFVRTDSLSYEKRFIEITRVTDDAVVVAAGLAEGDEVAVSQVFSLKAIGRFDQYAE